MKNDWEKKEKTCSAYLSSKFFSQFSASLGAYHFLGFVPTVQLIPYIYPAFVPFGRYFTSIPLYLWIRQSTLSSTCWPFSSDMLCINHNCYLYMPSWGPDLVNKLILFYSILLFIVYKQCARSRRVHIADHMNRFEYCHPDNNYNNDSFGSFLSKNCIFCSITRC